MTEPVHPDQAPDSIELGGEAPCFAHLVGEDGTLPDGDEDASPPEAAGEADAT